MASSIDLDGLVRRLRPGGSGRMIAGIAGAPGSGKSTVASQLEAALNAANPGTAAVLPMDGFHFDDGLLNELGRRARKGAPDTFDVGGLHQTLKRLRANAEDAVAVPVFDRSLEISRGSAKLIHKSVSVIIVEGNYLLLQQHPWAAIKPEFDVTVIVEASVDTLRKRLTARWEGYGLPVEEIRRKVEENDLPNGQLVLSRSGEPGFFLRND